jgi:hypothetical protein
MAAEEFDIAYFHTGKHFGEYFDEKGELKWCLVTLASVNV